MTSAPVNAILFTVLLIAFVLIASLIVQRHRSLRLKRRFGPEYDLTVAEFRIQPGAPKWNDGLVTQVIKSLTNTSSNQRSLRCGTQI
jgi:hypothetical protein